MPSAATTTGSDRQTSDIPSKPSRQTDSGLVRWVSIAIASTTRVAAIAIVKLVWPLRSTTSKPAPRAWLKISRVASSSTIRVPPATARLNKGNWLGPC